MSTKVRMSRTLAYFGMPVSFCIAGYLLLALGLVPYWGQLSAYFGLLVSKDAPNFNTKLTTVYDPNSLGAPQQAGGWISGYDVDMPVAGQQYGHIECEATGLDSPVYAYDSDEILMYGAGESLISLPPGFGSAVILSGHNNTFFEPLQRAESGQVIKFHTNWCDYEYKVSRTEVINEKELEKLLIKAANANKEELILYTCYPFQMTVGRKTDRFVVFADRTAGLDVKWRGLD